MKINYKSISNNKPLITVDDVLNSPEKDKRVTKDRTVEPKDVGKDVKHVIKGEFNLESQYHFYMEPQTCVVRPTEDGLEVMSATQWLDLANVAIAQCLNMPTNRLVYFLKFFMRVVLLLYLDILTLPRNFSCVVGSFTYI